MTVGDRGQYPTMTPRVADAVVATLLSMRFDEGLRVIHAEVVGLPEAPILVVRFEDAVRNPDGPQAAWWDFGTCTQFIDDAEGVASFAKIFLEELFHAGGRYEDRPVDASGVTWGEMDSETTNNRLPPFSTG